MSCASLGRKVSAGKQVMLEVTKRIVKWTEERNNLYILEEKVNVVIQNLAKLESCSRI